MQRWKQRPEGSNWGDFGPDDQRGRMNWVTREKVLQGVAEVKEGVTFCLSLPLDYPGGSVLNPRRSPPRLAPTLRDPQTSAREAALVSFHRFAINHDSFGEFYPIRCWTDGRHKLAINLLESDEFYDLARDPYEMDNRILDPTCVPVGVFDMQPPSLMLEDLKGDPFFDGKQDLVIGPWSGADVAEILFGDDRLNVSDQ